MSKETIRMALGIDDPALAEALDAWLAKRSEMTMLEMLEFLPSTDGMDGTTRILLAAVYRLVGENAGLAADLTALREQIANEDEPADDEPLGPTEPTAPDMPGIYDEAIIREEAVAAFSEHRLETSAALAEYRRQIRAHMGQHRDAYLEAMLNGGQIVITFTPPEEGDELPDAQVSVDGRSVPATIEEIVLGGDPADTADEIRFPAATW